jgi:hypothetical protein
MQVSTDNAAIRDWATEDRHDAESQDCALTQKFFSPPPTKSGDEPAEALDNKGGDSNLPYTVEEP